MKMEWNASGWFGGQIGSSAWILVAAILTLFRDTSIGLLLLAIFAAPNLIGYFIWRRKTLSCYAATQILIGLMGLAGLFAIYVLDRAKLWQEIQSGGSISAASSYILIALVFAILMLVFYLRFGRED